MEFKYITELNKLEFEENSVIPCKMEEYNCILIKNKYKKSFASIRRTDNLEIKFNTVVSSDDEIYYVHIIKSNKNDYLSNAQFSIIYDYVFKKICNPIDEQELSGLINSLEEYFRITPESDSHDLQIGVYGELLTVKNMYENGYSNITKKYHKNFFSKHDIEISRELRLEIKTTENKNRIHHFSHDQISRKDIKVYVVSVLLESSEEGTSLYDLFEQVIELYNDADAVFELRKLMKKCSVTQESKGLVFAIKKSIMDTKYFSAQELPQLYGDIPNGLTNIEYNVDCSFGRDVGLDNLIEMCIEHDSL